MRHARHSIRFAQHGGQPVESSDQGNRHSSAQSQMIVTVGLRHRFCTGYG
jgi:hypothetical protein